MDELYIKKLTLKRKSTNSKIKLFSDKIKYLNILSKGGIKAEVNKSKAEFLLSKVDLLKLEVEIIERDMANNGFEYMSASEILEEIKGSGKKIVAKGRCGNTYVSEEGGRFYYEGYPNMSQTDFFISFPRKEW